MAAKLAPVSQTIVPISIKVERILREEERSKKGKIYFFVKEEGLIENLMFRRERPYKEYRKLLRRVLEEVRAQGKFFVPENVDMKLIKWNQKAGCSCGCSPGFVIDDFLYRTAVYVTIG